MVKKVISLLFLFVMFFFVFQISAVKTRTDFGVKKVEPNNIQLKRGGKEVLIKISGKNLGKINGVVIGKFRGKKFIKSSIKTKILTKRSSSRQLFIRISAGTKVNIGENYILRLLGKKVNKDTPFLDVSTKLLKIIVVSDIKKKIAVKKTPVTTYGKTIQSTKIPVKPSGLKSYTLNKRNLEIKNDGRIGIIVVDGKNLEQITSAQIILNNKVVKDIKVELGIKKGDSRELKFTALPGAKTVANYKLRLLYGNRKVDLPASKFTMRVNATQKVSTTSLQKISSKTTQYERTAKTTTIPGITKSSNKTTKKLSLKKLYAKNPSKSLVTRDFERDLGPGYLPGKIPAPDEFKVYYISPNMGEVGSTAKIVGNGFLKRSGIIVKFTRYNKLPSIMANRISKTNGSLIIKIPTDANTGIISLTSYEGSWYDDSEKETIYTDFIYSVLKPPTITSFWPTHGPVGCETKIYGNYISYDFEPDFWFHNDKKVLNKLIGNDYAKRVVVPEGAISGPIKVETPNGSFVTNDSFIVETSSGTPPSISSFSPNHGDEGTEVTIIGEFEVNKEDNMISFAGHGGLDLIPHFSDGSILKIVTPHGPYIYIKTGKIQIQTPYGKSISSEVFYVKPYIESLDVSSGIIGSKVEIDGTNFNYHDLSQNIVKFNGVHASVSYKISTRLAVVVPVGATTGLVTLETPGGVATSPNVFVVIQE